VCGERGMARLFDRNMFIMLLSIMIGVIIITFFIADIMARTEVTKDLETKYTEEIADIESKNINFTNSFIQSLGLFDISREYRAQGGYNFDLALIWYSTALSLTNATELEVYKGRIIGSCKDAILNYTYSYANFLEAKVRFERTISYTTYEQYLNILDLYINLTKSGSRLMGHRINSSKYLMYLAENLTIIDGSLGYQGNVSNLTDMFNESLLAYQMELEFYEQLEDEIEYEYSIIGFSEIREEG